MKCPYCGNEIGENLIFCPSCGEKTQEVEKIELSSIGIEKDNYKPDKAEQRVQDKPLKKSNKVLISLLIVSVLAIIIIAFLVGRISGGHVPNDNTQSEISMKIETDSENNATISEDTEIMQGVNEFDETDEGDSQMAEETNEERETEPDEEIEKLKMEMGSTTWENITFSVQRTDNTSALLTIESQDSSGEYYFGPHMGYDSPVVLDLADGGQVETTIDKNLFWQQNNYNMNFVSGTNVTMVLKFDNSSDAAWDAIHICVTSLSMMGNNKDIVIEVD